MKMKRMLPLGVFALLATGSASAQGLYLYDAGSAAKESLPLKWVVGVNVIYDDNVNPGYGPKDSSFALNPSVGLSFVSMTPQTTWDVYARLGLIYYLDAPSGSNDVNSQSRVGVNFTHRFSERLRISSMNFASYELEPDYSYGYASSRQQGEYFFWQSDNSVGYRWSPRVATYTGLLLSGTQYADVPDNDRLSWQIYNQFRFQLTPQTVLTFDARYGQTTGNGNSSDYSDQYYLVGAEHRFSPNTIGIIRAGIQFHDVDGGSNSSSPYAEFALNSQVNQQLSVRSYARFGIEGYDTVQLDPETNRLVVFDDRQTLRFGLSAEYAVTPKFSVFGGVDYIPSSYGSGRNISAPYTSVSDISEDILNAYIGVSMKFNDRFTGTLSYNHTTSNSDIAAEDYNRNRISLGVSAEF